MPEPWPNEAAYDLGCSRDCRNEHTREWGRCDLAQPPAPRLNLYTLETFTASDGNTSSRFRPVTIPEAEAEIAKLRDGLAPCSVCGSVYALRHDGMVRRHRGIDTYCLGGGHPPRTESPNHPEVRG